MSSSSGLIDRCASQHDEEAKEEPPAGASLSSHEEEGQDLL
jgi:hypothetical protein